METSAFLSGTWSDWIVSGGPEKPGNAEETPAEPVPQSAAWHGQLAEAEFRQGKPDRAVPHLEEAFRLDPWYDFASRNLAAYWLDRNKLGEAGEVVETLRRNGHRWMAAELKLKLLLKQRMPERAAPILRELCLFSPEGTFYLGAAIEAFGTSRWQYRAERVLLDAAYEPKVNPDMGSYWVAMRIQLRKYDPSRIDDLADCGEVGRRALCAYLDSGNPKVFRYFEPLIRRHEAALRRTVAMWETAGAALVRAGKQGLAAEWLSAWRDYPPVSPRASYLLGCCLRFKGDYEEAGRAFERALAEPAHPVAGACQIALAIEDALADRLETARERLAKAEGCQVDGDSEILRRFAETVVRLGESRNPTARFHILRAELRKNYAGRIGPADRDLVRTFRRTLRGMGTIARCWPGLDAYFYAGVRTAKSDALPISNAEQPDRGGRIPWVLLVWVIVLLFYILTKFR